MEVDDYKSHHYQKCLSEELSIKISDGKLRRQETQDSAFSDEPIVREKRGRPGLQDTQGETDIYQPSWVTASCIQTDIIRAGKLF